MNFEDACRELVRSGIDLNLRQMAVLLHVARNPGLSVVHLADALGINKPSVTRALDRLGADRLVDRLPGREDRRLVTCTPTTKGLRMLAGLGVYVS